MTKLGTFLAAVSVALLAVIVVLLLTRLPVPTTDPIEPLCPSGTVPFGSSCAVPL